MVECHGSPSRPLSVQVVVALLISGLARPPDSWGGTSGALSGSAPVAAGPRISVVAFGLDPRASASLGALESAAEESLLRAGRFTVVPVHDAANPESARSRREWLVAGRGKVSEGRRALDELDNIRATECFVDAVAALRRADATRSFSELVDAWTLKAAAHATGGEVAAAKKDLEAVVMLKPDQALTPTYFTPELLAYAEERRRVASSASGDLTLRTEPVGAQVWIDGSYRGVSPLMVGGLSAGPHVVSAALGGFQLAQAELAPGSEVLKLESAELSVPWQRARAAVALDPDGPGRDRAAVELGRTLDVEQVLLVVAKKSPAGDKLELVAARLDVRDGHHLAYRPATVAGTAGLGSYFASLTSSDAVRLNGKPVTHAGGGGIAPGLVPSLALWGGGVLGLGLGAVFGGFAWGEHLTYTGTPQVHMPMSERVELRDRGLVFAGLADGLFIAGLTSAIVGTVVWLLRPKARSADASAAAAPPPAVAQRRDEVLPAAPTPAGHERPTEAASTAVAPAPAPAPREGAPKAKKLSAKQQREEERRRREEERREGDRRKADVPSRPLPPAEPPATSDGAARESRRTESPRVDAPKKDSPTKNGEGHDGLRND